MLTLTVPLAIYLFYFATGYRSSRQAPPNEPPPEVSLPAGAPAETAHGVYRAGLPGYEITLYDYLKSSSNTIHPDPGPIFASVPVLAPEGGGDGAKSPARWVLLDPSGNAYPPLPTDPNRFSNLKIPGGEDIPAGTAAQTLLFKVREVTGTFYLKLQTEEGVYYWRLSAAASRPGKNGAFRG